MDEATNYPHISEHFKKYIIRYADSRELPSKTQCKQFLTKNGIKRRTADELYYKIYNDAKNYLEFKIYIEP